MGAPSQWLGPDMGGLGGMSGKTSRGGAWEPVGEGRKLGKGFWRRKRDSVPRTGGEGKESLCQCGKKGGANREGPELGLHSRAGRGR